MQEASVERKGRKKPHHISVIKRNYHFYKALVITETEEIAFLLLLRMN